MALCIISALALLPGAMSHGYMSKPVTRAEIHCEAAGEPMWGGDGCLNHRSSPTTNIQWPTLPGDVPGTGIIPEPVCSSPGSPMKQSLVDQLNTKGPVQATYQQGQVIDVAFNVQANHGGYYTYRLCTDGSDNEECFQRGQLKFADGETWKQVMDGVVTYQVQLPPDVTCDRCTLSGRWDANIDENQVWVYCADIKIEGSGSSSTNTGSTNSGSTNTGSTSSNSCATTSDDCTASKCCSDPGMMCYEKNQYWASCKETCQPGIDFSEPVEYQQPWSCRELGLRTPATTDDGQDSGSSHGDDDSHGSDDALVSSAFSHHHIVGFIATLLCLLKNASA